MLIPVWPRGRDWLAVPTPAAELLRRTGREAVKSRPEWGHQLSANIGQDLTHIIRGGTVSVEKEGVGLTTLHEGDILGELVIFRPSARSATVRALSPTSVLEFEKETIMNFFKRREERLFKIFVINVINILCLKLDRTDDRIVQLESLLTRG